MTCARCAQINPKFIAFKGPSGEREEIAPGVFTFQPEDYIDIFRERGVTSIVRLNEADTYDKTVRITFHRPCSAFPSHLHYPSREQFASPSYGSLLAGFHQSWVQLL